MDNLKIDFLVKQKLQQYDNLGELPIPKDWDSKLNLKLQRVKSKTNSFTKYTVILVFIASINIGFIMFSSVNKYHNNYSRLQDLKVIADELLIPENF